MVLGEGLIRLLAALAGDRTCLLVLEDLHWADADTRALLLYLDRGAGRHPDPAGGVRAR